jgi:hypothetical protein
MSASSSSSTPATTASTHEKRLSQQLLNSISFSKSMLDDSSPGLGSNKIDKIRARFVEEALAAHNACRAKHGVQALTLNPEITRIAQEHADRLAEKKELVLSDSNYQGKSMGESLGFFFDKRVDTLTGLSAFIFSELLPLLNKRKSSIYSIFFLIFFR